MGRNRNSILTLQLFARSTNISTPPDIPIPLMFPRLPSVHCLVFPLLDFPTACCFHAYLVFPLPGVSSQMFPLPGVSTARYFPTCLVFPRLSGLSIAWCSNYVMFPRLPGVFTPAFGCVRKCILICPRLYSDACAHDCFFLLHTFYDLIISNW